MVRSCPRRRKKKLPILPCVNNNDNHYLATFKLLHGIRFLLWRKVLVAVPLAWRYWFLDVLAVVAAMAVMAAMAATLLPALIV